MGEENGDRSEADKYDKYGKIVGIVGVLFFGMFIGPVAIYLGYKARNEDPSKGKWGITLGVAGLFLWVGLLIWAGFTGVSEKAKVKATLKVDAEELEGTGTRYVHLSVFVKNNTDSSIEIDELRYFRRTFGIWGDPIKRATPDKSTIPSDSKIRAGGLVYKEHPSDLKGKSLKVCVFTSVGKFWTNVVKNYSYELK